LSIAKILKGLVWGFKVNDLLYENVSIIRELKKYGGVFVDVKLYDIPNTVANSVKRLSKAGADIITVHASGGIEMMKSAKKNSGKSKIIAVTILTSSSLNSPNQQVVKLAKEAIEAGLDGIVCSGHELKAVNRLSGIKSRLKIVPGIRPKWYKAKDDQKRKMTPNEAIKLGADYLVIGRPITKAKKQKIF
jgi:orotidine-5'-phosphate decarboxylase